MSSPSPSPIVPTIVMPSYEGALHIVEQIESIQAQTHLEWRLLVRDDASKDTTVSLVQEMANADPRIELIHDDLGRLGAIGNFSRTLEHAMQGGASWIALSDQDDHWLPHKLESQVRMANHSGLEPSAAILIHGDVAVVDADLELIHPSLHRLMGLRNEPDTPLATLLIQNFVTGCSCMMNRALLEIALPIPAECVMADWWLALCAAASGALAFESRPALLYRQHSMNTIGARPLRNAIRRTLKRTLSLQKHDPEEFVATLRQALALESRLLEVAARQSPNSKISQSAAFVSDYLNLYRNAQSRWDLVAQMHRRKIRRQNAILDAMLKLQLLSRAIDLPNSESNRTSELGKERCHDNA